MIAKFGFCAFGHPQEDFNSGSQVSTHEAAVPPPEYYLAQFSSTASFLRERPKDGQRILLLRHNCEGEIGCSYVRVDEEDCGVSREGLVASSCVGLPDATAAEWQPPTYDVDTHKHPSVFKQAS
jgi:hypothetical protein